MIRCATALFTFSLLLLCCSNAPVAQGAPRTWIGGNVDWVDGGSTANWNPADEPDSDDEAIFNTVNTVNLGSNNSVNGLTLSGGIDVLTNEFDLTVDGLVQVSGAGTSLIIDDAAGSINADDVTINADGGVALRGGTLTLDEEAGTSLLDINAGGRLNGAGAISFLDTPLAITTVLVNDGELSAFSPSFLFGPPPVGTLTIDSAGPEFSRVDLDGAGGAGVVTVNRNQTLDLNIPMFGNAFGGTINLFQESSFDSVNLWTMLGGSIVVDNGFVDSVFPLPDVPAGTSYLKGGGITQIGGTIDVVDTDGTLQLDVPFTMVSGTFTNNGTVVFNGFTNIITAAGYEPNSVNAQTIVNADLVLTDSAGNFNWDGLGAADTTVNGSAMLSLTVNQIDTANNIFGGTVTLNDDADLSVNVTATEWTLGGSLVKNGAGTSLVTGDRVVVTGAITANAGTLDIPAVTTSSLATLSVAGNLYLGGATVFGGAASVSGAGVLRMEGTSTVTANTTIDVATFDWDGLNSGSMHTIDPNVVFTINSPSLAEGSMNDPITLAGNSSQLIVNGPAEWTATAAINANDAAAFNPAVIGGTSRLVLSGSGAILNVNGDTNVNAPITFGALSTTSIDAGFTLNLGLNEAIYDGGSITGAGIFTPAPINTVTADTTIDVATFDFDGGDWVVEADATLTVNVSDYDTIVTNAFDDVITLNGGAASVTTGDPTFVMDGTLNMNASGGINVAQWSGESIVIGNDTGVLGAALNVTGVSGSLARFLNSVEFNSDADVDVAAGVTLELSGTVNFNTVNAANNAQFTGAGAISFNKAANVNEAVTLNMVGGTVDLDGADSVGEFINVDAPLTINAATLSNFGRVNSGGGVNTLDVNNSVGAGVLTVNLDDPAASWTLNGPGVMNLVNDNTTATLLAGNAVNINGTLNVTGDVRTDAALHIGGVVNINTAGEQLVLNGDDVVSTMVGGTVNGPGLLAANAGRSLRGFGTINANIDFNGSSFLHAENGTLTIAGAILDAASINATGAAAVLNVVNPWNSGVADVVGLSGGTIQGGAITNNATNGIQGRGTVTSQVINNTRLSATGGTLLFQTVANDNDWDGAGAGLLRASGAQAVLELRDVGAAFGFTGVVEAASGGRVFANGFALDFNAGSTLSLTGGTYESSSTTNLGSAVTANAGGESILRVADNSFLNFESTSVTTLNANLRLDNNNITIDAGATFSGAGALIVDAGSSASADGAAAINVLLVNEGDFHPGGIVGVGAVTVKDYSQASTGELFVEMTGALPNQFDRVDATGISQLDGRLFVDLDNGFNPTLGAMFDILTASSVSGEFDQLDFNSLPVDKAFAISYLPTAVRLTVVTKPIFDADFDDDGDVDQTDYTIWKGAFNLNSLGDANGDGLSDAADYTVWRDTLGSGPVAPAFAVQGAVPEPSTAILLASVVALSLIRFRA